MDTMLSQLLKMQEYFATRATYGFEFRKQQLQKLKEALYKYEQDIYQALHTDLKKKSRGIVGNGNRNHCYGNKLCFKKTTPVDASKTCRHKPLEFSKPELCVA